MKDGFIKEKYRSRVNAMKKSEMPDMPISMLLEPTNACNHKCTFCYNASSERPISTLDVNLAQHIMEDAFSQGVKEVGFYLNGEPLLHTGLEDLVALAKKIGFSYIYITTNGVLAKPERITKLVKQGLNSIKFSINSGERVSYQEVHGVDAFQIVMKNLQGIIEKREELSSLGLIRIMVSSVLMENDSDEDILILQKKLAPFLDDYSLYNRLPRPKIGSKKRFIEFCPFPFTQLFITSSGILTLCCQDSDNHLAVADLSKQSIHDAWYSELAKGLRKRHLTNNFGKTLCNRCLTGGGDSIEPLSNDFYCV